MLEQRDSRETMTARLPLVLIIFYWIMGTLFVSTKNNTFNDIYFYGLSVFLWLIFTIKFFFKKKRTLSLFYNFFKDMYVDAKKGANMGAKMSDKISDKMGAIGAIIGAIGAIIGAIFKQPHLSMKILTEIVFICLILFITYTVVTILVINNALSKEARDVIKPLLSTLFLLYFVVSFIYSYRCLNLSDNIFIFILAFIVAMISTVFLIKQSYVHLIWFILLILSVLYKARLVKPWKVTVENNIHIYIDIIKAVLVFILFIYHHLLRIAVSKYDTVPTCDFDICYYNGSKMETIDGDYNRCNNTKCQTCSQCTGGNGFWAISEDFGGKDDDWTVDYTEGKDTYNRATLKNLTYNPDTTSYLGY